MHSVVAVEAVGRGGGGGLEVHCILGTAYDSSPFPALSFLPDSKQIQRTLVITTVFDTKDFALKSNLLL